jgi:excisionase family DNA binding protein
MYFKEEDFESKQILGGSHILTVKDLAAYCQISEITVRRALKSGELQGLKFGNSWRIEGQVARAWIASKLHKID